MTQADFGNLSSPISGASLIDDKLEPAINAIQSSHSGSSRPSYVKSGMLWINTTTNPWVLNIYDGAGDIPLGTLNTSTDLFTPANAGVTDGDKGDIIVSGDDWQLDNNAVSGAVVANAGISLPKLATQAANTVLANATGSAASPTAIALAANKLLGRGSSGNAGPITLGTNLSFDGTTLNASGGGGTKTTQTASNDANITFSSLDFENNDYEYYFEEVLPVANAADLQLYVSDDDGVGFSINVISQGILTANTSTAFNTTSGAMAWDIRNDATFPPYKLNGRLILRQNESTGMVQGEYIFSNRDDGNGYQRINIGVINSELVSDWLTDVRFLCTSTNINSGKIIQVERAK